MSTSFLSPGWRMPTNNNQSKQSNYSMYIDGGASSGRIDTNYYLPEGTKPKSISYWFKNVNPNGWASTGDYIYTVAGGEMSVTKVFGMGITSTSFGGYIWFIGLGSGDYKIPSSSTGTMTTDVWYHIVVTYDDTRTNNLHFYLDGVKIDEVNKTLNTGTTSTVKIGSNPSGGAGQGAQYVYVDQACFFDYALTDNQVTTLWGGGTAVSNPMALPSPPIAYYPLGGSAGAFRTPVNVNDQWLIENNAIGDYVFNFNNSQDINCGNNSALQMDRVFTMSCWINTTSTSRGSIMGTYISSGYYIDLMASGTVQGGYHSTGSHFLRPSSSTVNDGNWHHICYVISGTATDGSDLNVYVDGQLNNGSFTSSGTPSGAVTTNPFKINLSGYSGRYTGETSNVQLFNTALSGPEVTTLYNYGSPIQTLASIPQSSNLKAWYKLDASEVYNSTTTEWSIDNNQNPSTYPSSLDFDGAATSSFIEFNNSISLNNNYTFSIWFNPDVVNKLQVLAYDTTSAIKFISLESNSTSIRVRDGVNEITFTVPTILANNWYNLVLQVSAGVAKLFLNNNESSTGSLTLNSSWGIKRINGYSNQYGGNYNFGGEMSNVQVFSTALLETGSNSIETLYNNGTPLADMSSFSSLVSWWKLNNTTTGIEDSKGSNNGTNNGATEYTGFVNTLAGDSSGMSQANLVQSDLQTVAPYSKYAMSFDGTDDYIDCGNDASFNLTTGLTVSAWVKLTAYQNDKFILAKRWASNSFQIATAGGGKSQCSVWIGSTRYDAIGSTVLSADTWYNIVGTFDGSNVKVYVNSTLEDTTPASGNLATTTDIVSIAKGLNNNSYNFNGSISNVSIWNAALTSAQVTEVYNQGLPSNLNSNSAYSNLVSWWQLGENSSFDGNDWICADEKGTNNGDSIDMGVDALTNGVGTTANGVSSGMGVGALIGDAPYSTANAISSNMSVLAKGTDPADIPS